MVPVNQLFVAMETNDGDLAASLFTDNAQLKTISVDGSGETVVITASKLVDVFRQPKEKVYLEPIWNEKIHVDGSYAVVWVEYAFYLGKTFSHCGVDMFQLIYNSQEWKIFELTDTRRRTDCHVPSEISERYK